MAINLTVTLTDEQVTRGLAAAQVNDPLATNAELKTELEGVATHAVFDYLRWYERQAKYLDDQAADAALEADMDAVYPPQQNV